MSEVVKFDEAPKSSDSIWFEIETTENGLAVNPDSIDRIVIYYIEAKPGHNWNEADPLLVIGNRDIPAWKNGITTEVKQITDENGQLVNGKFSFTWIAVGRKAGSYVIFWQWGINGNIFNNHKTFNICVDNQIMTSDHTAYTPPDKYKMLFDLYTPSMYKTKVKDSDYTPEVIEKLNASIAEGFTMLEDLANQLGTMLEANLAHQSVLPLLANLFGLKLRSTDPDRWRAQIKRAVHLFKRKGTLRGLQEALNQAGIKLVKLTKLWQVMPFYTKTDTFVIPPEGRLSPTIGKLSKPPFSVNTVKLKSSNGDFINLPEECVLIVPDVELDTPSVVWNGFNLEEAINLFPNDVILVSYTTQKIPEDKKSLEDYINSLPLADDRPDDTPTKNWDIRLIEDDDALFDVVVPTRYPFAELQAYGKVRTKFLYGEQVYNMDTYDGSLRNSFIPCDLDATFVDNCSACQSSQFNVDLEIENLSDQRIKEAQEIIKDYVPFHARLHSINIAGAVNEFVLLPKEEISCLVQTGVPKQITEVSHSESIDYEIQWRDGTKEKAKL